MSQVKVNWSHFSDDIIGYIRSVGKLLQPRSHSDKARFKKINKYLPSLVPAISRHTMGKTAYLQLYENMTYTDQGLAF